MPLSKNDLLTRIVDAIQESGWNALYVSDVHPFQLIMVANTISYRIQVYIWNMTHGGGAARPSDEYRIQVTGLTTDHFVQLNGQQTLVLGWWDEGQVFAGFDVRKHSRPLGKSPSLQIREENLQLASEMGFSPCDKGNQEIAIAFRPDFFATYVQFLEQLHDFGRHAQDLDVLIDATTNDTTVSQELPTVDVERRTVIQTITRKVRESNFKRRVMRDYESRCALCGVQLNLVDAAHIVPVYDSSSTDLISNGVALCALHHRAFDTSLVTFRYDYAIVTNPVRIEALRQKKMADGLEEFERRLNPQILLPKATGDYPDVHNINLANQIRGWAFSD